MPPTSKKLRGHIGLAPSVCPLRLLLVVILENRLSQELELLYVASVQKISEHVFFSVGPNITKLCPFFDSAIITIEQPCQHES